MRVENVTCDGCGLATDQTSGFDIESPFGDWDPAHIDLCPVCQKKLFGKPLHQADIVEFRAVFRAYIALLFKESK